MAISDIQKIDWLWKKVGYGVAKTDVNSIKSAVNESIASGLLLRADQIWGDAASIPATIPTTSTSVVTLETVEATEDATATPRRTWSSGYENWIPPQFGATYLVNVFIDNPGAANPASTGNKIFAAGSGNNDEWFFDYASGTLNFIGENLPSGLTSGKSIYIQGAVYSGLLGPASGDGGQFGEVIVGGGGGGSITTGPGEDLEIGAGDGGETKLGNNDDIVIDDGGNTSIGQGGGTTRIGENVEVDPNGNMKLSEIAINGNRIETYNSNANMELQAAGTGIIDILSDTVVPSLKVSDLTASRVLLAGTDGEIEDSGNLTFDGTTLTLTGDANITGDLTLGGNITIGDADTDSITVAADFESHLIPDADGTYDLGSATKKWRSLYVSGQTIYLGTLQLQDNGAGGLVIVSEDGTRTNFEASVVDAERIVVDEIEIDGNRIRTLNTNANLELLANGTGTITAQGIDIVKPEGNVIYVTANGDDNNSGALPNDAYATIRYALSQATTGDIVNISAGTFEETFPLDVPANVTVRGAGLRATQIKPSAATRDLDCFRVDGGVVIEGMTIREMEYNTTNDTGYAIRYKPTASVTIRSAYMKDITVANFGSSVRQGTNAADDPYGFDAGDAGRGALVDGASIATGSIEPAMLFDSCTFIVPNSVGLIMTNGARVEWLNCFTYFAHEAIKGITGTQGRGGAGKTRITLGGVVGTIAQGDTATFTSTDGSTVVTLTVDAVENSTTLVQDGKVDDLEGFDTTPASITFSGGATATSILRYDRKEFAAEMRSIASANVYGNFGLVADGADTSLRMVSHNFGYIGVGKRLDNDDSAVIQANEITEANGGRVYYSSVDQRGDFRIGDHFTVDQQTGNTTFQGGTFDVTTLTGINFVSGVNSSTVDPFKIETGNIRLAGNTISSITGDINVTPAGTAVINLSADTSVSGTLTVGQDLTVNGDTNISGNVDITGNLVLGGNITIGDADTDSITVAADFESDLVPDADETYNLGSNTKQWKNLFVQNIEAGELTIEDISINGNRIETINSDSNLEIDTAGAGTIELQSDTNITGDATVSGTLDVTGDTTITTVTASGLASLDGGINVNDLYNVATNGNTTIGATLDVTGDTTLANLDAQETTLSSATVSDLTTGRVVLAGTAGAIEDSGNLTFDGTLLDVTGNVTLSGTLDVNTDATIATAKIEDLTAGRVVLAGTGGEIEDSGNLTFDGTTLGITGNIDVSGDVTIGGNIQIGDADTDAITVAADFESHLIPNEDETYDLGSATKKWRNLYVAGQTIHLGGIQLKEENGGFKVVDASGNEMDITGGTIFADRLIGEDITIDGNRIQTNSSNSDLEFATAGTGTLELLTDTNITGAATVSSTLGVTGATTLSDTLGVTGATTLSSTLGVTGATTLSDTLGVTGATTLNDTLGVTGATTLNDTLGVTGATTLSSTLGVTGATTLSDTLGVTGDTTLSSNATVGGTLGVTGATTLSSTLGVTGTSTLADTNITGILTVTGSISVDNIDIDGSTIGASTDITIDPNPTGTGGTLNVAGALDVTDNATVGGTLGVTGATTLSSTLGVTGETTLASAIVSDLTDNRIVLAGTSGAIEDSADLTFDGTTFDIGQGNFTVASATGNTAIAGTLDVTGASTFATVELGNLTAGRVVLAGTNGSVEDSANLTFDGTTLTTTALALDNITIDGNTIATTTGTLTIDPTPAGSAGTVTIQGDLQVMGTTTTINSTVTTLDDPILTLGGDTAPTTDDTKDKGIEFRWHTGTDAKVGFFGFDRTDEKFTFIPDATNSSEVFSGTAGNVKFGNIDAVDINATGNVTIGGNITIGDADTDGITIAGEFDSHLIPNDTHTYDLGSDTKRWRDLYLSGNSIYLGDVTMSQHSGGMMVHMPGTSTMMDLYAAQVNAGTLLLDNIRVDGNLITTTESNSNLELATGGTGSVDLLADTNITGTLDVSGTVTTGDLNALAFTANTIESTGNTTVGSNLIVNDDILTHSLKISDNRITALNTNDTLELAAAGTGAVDVVGKFTVGSTTEVEEILDEDDLVSDSDTAIPTQQSVKAYVDANIGAVQGGLSGDQITLGDPTDSSYTDGAYKLLSGTGNIAEAMDQLNETMLNVANNTFVRSVTFTGTPLAGGEGTSVTLTIVKEGNPNNYDIDWGDGTTETVTSLTPSHTYTSNTNSPYTVVVRAYHSDGAGYGSEATQTREDYVIIYTADPVMAFRLYRASSGGTALTGNDLYVNEGDSLYMENITTNTTMADVTYSMDWGDGTTADAIGSDADAGGVLGARLQHTWGTGTATGNGTDTLTLSLLTHTTATPSIFPLTVTEDLKVYDPNITAPDGLGTKTLIVQESINSNPRLAYGFTDNTGSSTLTAGSTVKRTNSTVAVFTKAQPTFAYDADSGDLSALVDGTNAGTITLSSSDNTGSATSLEIVEESDYNLLNTDGSDLSFSSTIYTPNLYKGFKARVNHDASTFAAGIHTFQLEHSVTGSTNVEEFVHDPIGDATVLAGTVVEGTAGTKKYISGVPYYAGGNTVILQNWQVEDFCGQVYNDYSTGWGHPVTVSSGTDYEGTSDVVAVIQNYTLAQMSNPSNPMLNGSNVIANVGTGGTPYTMNNITVNVAGATDQISIANLQVRSANVNGFSDYVDSNEKIQVHTAAQTGINETAIPVSDSLGATYTDDGKRSAAFLSETTSTPAFNGATNFYTSNVFTEASDPGVEGTQEATVRLGVLKHDTTNYSTFLPAGPNRTGDSGTQYFTFAFRRSAVSKFRINITSSGIGGLWIAVPGSTTDTTSGLNGWLRADTAFGGSGAPGSSTGGNGSDGVADGPANRILSNTSLSGNYQMTLGTVSTTSATGNVVLVRIALNAGNSITSLSILEGA